MLSSSSSTALLRAASRRSVSKLGSRSLSSSSSSSTQLLAPVWTHLTNVQPTRGEGIYLYDDKERYTDFTSGIGVTNTGHCHPKVVQAIQEQASQLLFGQVNIVVPPVTLQLAEELQRVMPAQSGLNRFFFSNSGSEAVEASIKLARHATGKTNVIVFQGSFHGRSHQTMALTTAKTIYRVQYQPLPSGVFVAPFPHPHYYGWDEETTVDFCWRELQTLLKGQSRPDETAAILIEPVLGEGGYVPTPRRFMTQLRQLCNEHNILLICDEVQSGFGRTGQMFAMDHYDDGVTPDILVMAKGLGSGLPISAIASRDDLMQHWIPGSHGGTYGGGAAVSAAAAVATLGVLQNEGLVANAAARGQQLQTRLWQLQQDHEDVITHVRGLGCMLATEFVDSATAKAVQRACLDRNLWLLTCGTYENVIRWIPPLVVTAEQMDEALDTFEDALHQVTAGSTDGDGVSAATR